MIPFTVYIHCDSVGQRSKTPAATSEKDNDDDDSNKKQQQ